MPESQYRYTEIRAIEGRTIYGAAMPYGEVARIGPYEEVFESRAFGDISGLDLLLNFQHTRGRLLARTDGGGLTLTDTDKALEIRAELPPTQEGNDALELATRRILRGFSVEFTPITERMEGRRRILSRARLDAIGLVDTPAYTGATISAIRSLETSSAPRKRRKLWL